MKTSIQPRIAHILRRHFLVRPPHFLPTQELDRDYNLGPLEKLELANCLEAAFHFDFYDQEVAEFRTLGSVVTAVRRHLRAIARPKTPHFQPAYELPVA